MNSKLNWIDGKAVLSQHLPGEILENREKFQSMQPICEPVFEVYVTHNKRTEP
jgi:hypothetical protein